MSQLLINTLGLFIAVSGCLLVGALVLNEVPLNEPPGALVRLQTYLTRNVAETRRNALFPELELRSYRLAPKTLFARVEHALELLGWRVVNADPEQLRLRAVVESRLLRFKDDVDIQIQIGDQGSELRVRSQSRLGRGDLGANAHHVMELHATLARQL